MAVPRSKSQHCNCATLTLGKVESAKTPRLHAPHRGRLDVLGLPFRWTKDCSLESHYLLGPVPPGQAGTSRMERLREYLLGTTGLSSVSPGCRHLPGSNPRREPRPLSEMFNMHSGSRSVRRLLPGPLGVIRWRIPLAEAHCRVLCYRRDGSNCSVGGPKKRNRVDWVEGSRT